MEDKVKELEMLKQFPEQKRIELLEEYVRFLSQHLRHRNARFCQQLTGADFYFQNMGQMSGAGLIAKV